MDVHARRVLPGVLLLVVVLMAWDHLVGNQGGSDDKFPVDPPTFVLALVLSGLAAAVVFGLVLRRTTGMPAAAWLTGVAVVTAPFLSWLGVPQVIAGGGLALGLRLREAGRARTAYVVIALCLLVLLLGILGTAFPPEDSD